MSDTKIPLRKKSGSKNNILMILMVIIIVLLLTVTVILIQTGGKDSAGATSDPKPKTADTQQPPPAQEQRTPGYSENTPTAAPPPSTGNSKPAPGEQGLLPGVYPQASTRYLRYSDISGMHVWDVLVMRNEIFARYGYIFKLSWELRDYFNSQPWYVPRYSDVSHLLTPVERANVEFLTKHTPKFDMNNIRGSNTYVP